MYKIYLKQAWALIRQERLFSSVYIVGTGLAISLVMVLSIVFYVKMASIYPEMDRDRLLTVKSAALKNEKGGTSSGPVSPASWKSALRGCPAWRRWRYVAMTPPPLSCSRWAVPCRYRS